MSDVLSGLESMGLGNLSNIELFNDKKQKADEEKKKAEKAKEVKELEEKDLIYLKNVECPCCGKEGILRSHQASVIAHRDTGRSSRRGFPRGIGARRQAQQQDEGEECA